MPEKSLTEGLVKHYMLSVVDSHRDIDGKIDIAALGWAAAWEFNWPTLDLDTIFRWAFEVSLEMEED
jgi:hypothetical protein